MSPAPSHALNLLRMLSAGSSPAELSTVPQPEARDLALQIHAELEARRRREAELTALVETARDLAAVRDPAETLDAIVRRARALLGTDLSYVTLYDPERGDTYMRATAGSVNAEFQSLRLLRGDGLGGLVASTRAPYWTRDYLADSRYQHTHPIDDAVGAEGIVSICGTPMLVEGEFVGVLFAANRTPRNFTPDEVALLGSFAALAAIAIVRSRSAAETAAALAHLSEAHELVRKHTAGVERAAAVHDRLLELVLAGGGADDITAALGEVIGGWVVLLDSEGQRLAAFGESPLELEALTTSLAVHKAATSGRLAEDGGLWATGVMAAQELLGTLVLGGTNALDDADRRTIERAGAVTALLLLMERAANDAEQRIRTDLVSDLVSGRGDAGALHARARAGGFDPGAPHALLVIRAEDDIPRRALLMTTQAAAPQGSLVGEHSGEVIALVPATDAHEAATQLRVLLQRRGAVTVGGAGPVAKIADLPEAWTEGRRTVRALQTLGMRGQAASSGHLGFAGLVVGQAPDVTAYVRQHLGPLMDYDERRGASLVQTLEAYFASGSSPRRAATDLHVHVNTVSQRLERISSLLDTDWQAPAAALELQLALRLRRLRGAGDTPDVD